MIFSEAIVCDLRRGDNDKIASSIMANNLADAIWEHAIHVASYETNQPKMVSISLYAITIDSHIMCLLENNRLEFAKLKEALINMINGRAKADTTGTCCPLCQIIDRCSLIYNVPIIVFMSSTMDIDQSVEKSLKRIQVNHSNDVIFTVVNDNDDVANVTTYIQSLQLTQVYQIVNSDECYFQVFRSVLKPYIFKPRSETIQINGKIIKCQQTPLFTEPGKISEYTSCKCHGLLVKTAASQRCSVTNKVISDKSTKTGVSINEFPIDLCNSHEILRPMIILSRIEKKNISESFLIGITQILESTSPEFHRLINELRRMNEALIAFRQSSAIIGGQYFILFADSKIEVIHCKQLANRAQIVNFSNSLEPLLPESICTEPILDCIEKIEEINPYYLGIEEMTRQFGYFLKSSRNIEDNI